MDRKTGELLFLWELSLFEMRCFAPWDTLCSVRGIGGISCEISPVSTVFRLFTRANDYGERA